MPNQPHQQVPLEVAALLLVKGPPERPSLSKVLNGNGDRGPPSVSLTSGVKARTHESIFSSYLLNSFCPLACCFSFPLPQTSFQHRAADLLALAPGTEVVSFPHSGRTVGSAKQIQAFSNPRSPDLPACSGMPSPALPCPPCSAQVVAAAGPQKDEAAGGT